MTYGYGGSSAILGIGTALPPHRIRQEDAAERFAHALSGQRRKRPNCAPRVPAVRRRDALHVRAELETAPEGSRYLAGSARSSPSTGERGAAYREHALPLALAAASRALQEAGAKAEHITHLFAVSCTGLYLPGLDAELVRHLGLRRDVQRLPLSFAGCAAGLKAVGIASGIAEQELGAKVLVVCVELCTLHVQTGTGRNEMLAAAIFGDGAAACVVGRPGVAAGSPKSAAAGSHEAAYAGPRVGRGLFALGRYRSVLLEEGAEEMTWHIGDHGYELFLSPRIPELLVKLVPEELARLTAGLPLQEPELWAIHPGGRGILDALQRLYGLSERQLAPSRAALRNVGNVSSATILFVLDELRRAAEAESDAERGGQGRGGGGEASGCGVALAFGPGLTAELLAFRYIAQDAAMPI
ncbi:type III polyketide synthase [Gordoniibacillus kamchatkensis]|uniref:type III polyketide synthase n=1 Tax=Gordoniibacillus kamchatkensis TaxID=1590651 RepID=UPI0006977E63|nr:type III polyketide synthase [Paenibacillus sp. VKM B-2647]